MSPERADEDAGRRRHKLRFPGRRHIDLSVGFLHLIEDIVHYLVAGVLLAVACVVLWHSASELIHHDTEFAERVTAVVNGVLFVIIVLEILRTVVAHFEDADLQLMPFLIIGIISAVRHILTIGAQSSLGVRADDHSHDAEIELGVNALVVLALVIGLILVRRSEPAQSTSDTTFRPATIDIDHADRVVIDRNVVESGGPDEHS